MKVIHDCFCNGDCKAMRPEVLPEIKEKISIPILNFLSILCVKIAEK